MADPRLARPSWRGRTNLDAITIAAIEYAEQLAGFAFVVTQGSYQGAAGDPDSAGTHARGGTFDGSTKALTREQKRRMVWALRMAGFAAWLRTPDQGDWVEHVHAVLVDHPDLAPSAARQVTAYRAGRNGLKNGAPDDGPRLDPIPVYVWEDDDMSKITDQLDRIETKLDGLVKAEKARAVINHERAKREVADDAAKGEQLAGLDAKIGDDTP